MDQLFNFHDTWIVAEANWLWLAVALCLGIWVGYRTAGSADKKA